MTALADALTAAQSRAVAALGKQYRAGLVEQEAAVAWLESFGLDDRVDMTRWFSCLDALRQFGGDAPGTTNGTTERPPEPMTPAQRSLIERLVSEKNVPAPDLEQRTKQEAHEIIDTLKAGTYDPVKWSIPF